MLIAIGSAFFGLLILGIPIAVMLVMITMMGVYFFTNIPGVIVIQQLFNGLDRFVTLAVPLFITAGAIMAEGDLARRITAVGEVLVGRLPGGLAITTVFGCAFFAAISGSSLATVVAIGTVMVPALIKAGYPKKFATGLITSSGSLGILIPPSIPMILMCIVMGTSVGKQFMAGFLPGLMIATLLSIYIYIIARKNKWPTARKYTFGESLKVIKEGSWALVMPVIVLGGIYTGFTTPTEAAAVALIYALIVELCVFKKLEIKKLPKIITKAAITSAALTFILSAAFGFAWLVTNERLPVMIAEFLTGIITSKWVFLLFLNGIFLILGCFMELISVIIVIGPILVLTLEAFNIDLIHFGIFMIVNYEVGMMTPPFGLNIFVAMGVTKEPFGSVARAVIPTMLVFLVSLAIVTYVPEVSLILPRLIYG